MKFFIFSLVIWNIVFLSWCTQPSSDSLSTTTWDEQLSGTNNNDIQAPLVDILSGKNGQYVLFFDDNSMSKTFTLYHKARQENKVFFINDGYKKLDVAIILPKNNTWANLRLSYIVMPDGTTDGPFGLQTEYDLNQNGGYELIVSEIMMAGDPWTGDAQITVKVSN